MNEFIAFLCGMSGTVLGAVLPTVLFAIIAVVALDWLRGRLRRLERRLKALEGRAIEAPEEEEPRVVGEEAEEEPQALEAEPEEPTEEVGALEPTAAPPAPAEPGTTEETEEALSGDEGEGTRSDPVMAYVSELSLPSPERVAMWIGAILGALALIVGMLLGLVAVVEAGFVGPAARICLALISGTGLWCFGALVRLRVPVLGSALSGVGVTTLYGALFAAHGFYDLIGPTTTFALLVAVVTTATLRATVRNDRFLAHLGVIGGILAPVLVSTGNNAAIGLFTYLFLLVSGVCFAAAWRGWFDVVLTSAVGAGALYFGWTITWYAPDSTMVALASALALGLPYAAVSASGSGSDWQRQIMVAVGSLAAAGFMWLAIPWLVPVDPIFTDPRTGLTHVQVEGPALWVSSVVLALLPAGGWLAGRIRRSIWRSAITTVALLVPLFAWTMLWTHHLDEAVAAFGIGVLGPLTVAALLHVGARRTGWGWTPLAAMVGTLIVIPGLGLDSGSSVAFGVVGTVVLVGVSAFVSAPGAVITAALVGLGLGLVLVATEVRTLGTWWVVAAALWTVGLSLPALGARWRQDRWPSLPWLGGAAAGVVVFIPLYAAWDIGLDGIAIGLLPVLLGMHGLLAAALLIRVHGLHRNSPALAVAVGVALAGATFALPVELETSWLTVGWALEAAALAWLSSHLRHPLVRLAAVALGLTIAVRVLLNPWALSYGDAAGWPIVNWTLWTWGVPTLAFVATAHFVQKSRPEGFDWLVWSPIALRVLAMLTGFALVNVEVSHAFQDAGPIELGGRTMLQGMVRSIAWGSWGMFLLLLGLGVNSRYTRFIGFTFVLVATAKVFVYDIWSLPGFVRVGSLLGLGVLLLVAAFLFERLVIRESPLSSAKEDS